MEEKTPMENRWGMACTDRMDWRRSRLKKNGSFFELHIEQGPILEDENIDNGGYSRTGTELVTGHTNRQGSHTGSTPMPKRINAGLGMARITQLVDEIALSHSPLAVGAVGHYILS